mmetsp:Transcript_85812/g.171760  ORF Transcript_85812/g.171760 Transcript_85812/m.171760 type:complete len:85 (+) Transcript_85812:322-576(+)
MVFPKTSCAFVIINRCSKELRGHVARVLHLAAAAEGGTSVLRKSADENAVVLGRVRGSPPLEMKKAEAGQLSAAAMSKFFLSIR